jgi:hypothetical protein
MLTALACVQQTKTLGQYAETCELNKVSGWLLIVRVATETCLGARIAQSV